MSVVGWHGAFYPAMARSVGDEENGAQSTAKSKPDGIRAIQRLEE